MRLVSDLVKIFRQQMSAFKQLAVWSAAVPRMIGPHIEMRVDVNADPQFRPVNVAHRPPVGVRDIVAAANDDNPFSVAQKARYKRRLTVVNFLEAAVDLNVAGIINAFLDVERSEAI